MVFYPIRTRMCPILLTVRPSQGHVILGPLIISNDKDLHWETNMSVTCDTALQAKWTQEQAYL